MLCFRQRVLRLHQICCRIPINYQRCQFTVAQPLVKPSKEDVIQILRTCQAVCFDVDSTVIPEEGIDELASFKGIGSDVAAWTTQAMSGEVLFQDALSARLNIIKPSEADLKEYLSSREHNTVTVPRLTPGIEELIAKLHRKGKIVYLVSGGFRQMIEPIADRLGIPVHRIFANRLIFSPVDGSYVGFDESEPTSRDGGKPAVLKSLIHAHGYGPIVMIGDGVTDMQAKPPADLFIGYGGVVAREAVRAGADMFVTDLNEITSLLE